MTWTCPACSRTFGRHRQGHECAPALTVEEYFSTGPVWERPVYEAVADVLVPLEGVWVEAVSVGILFKRGRTFVELRPRTKWVDLGFVLPRRITHPVITRYTTNQAKTITQHIVRMTSPSQVDSLVADWLTESWAACP